MRKNEVLLSLKGIGYKLRTFNFVLTPQELEYFGEYEIVDDIKVKISLVRIDIGYRMEVKGETKVKFICSRCLDEFIENFSFSDSNIVKRGSDTALEALKDEDVESIYVDGYELNVLPIVRGIFIASLPIKPLCSPSCRGICPVCGFKMEGEHVHEGVKKVRKLGIFLEGVLKGGGKK